MKDIIITMKIHQFDKEMIEIFTVNSSPTNLTLWCVSHYDLMYESDTFDRLKNGEQISFKLTEV